MHKPPKARGGSELSPSLEAELSTQPDSARADQLVPDSQGVLRILLLKMW